MNGIRRRRIGATHLGWVAIVGPLAGTSPAAQAEESQSSGAPRPAAEAGDRTAQYQLGLAYRDGVGVAKDLQSAYFWLSLAATAPSASQSAAQRALEGVASGLTPAERQAGDRRGFEEIHRLANAGRAWAQTFLGAAYFGGTEFTPKNQALGLEWFQRAATQGDPQAQFRLGDFFLGGTGVTADAVRAMEFFKLAARQGHAEAQSLLGWGYYMGTGVLQDYPEAIRWWRLSADQGWAQAQANLGDVYRLGDKGAPQDYVESARWYMKAAEQGHAVAQSNLGTYYERGEGVPQDGKLAAKWYARAAEQGYTIGQSNYALLLAAGKLVPQDYVEAHKWANLAAARATPENQKLFAESRDKIAAAMTPAQIAEAQKRAREWLDAFSRRGGH
jgi:uncharacterized protein